MAPPDGQGPDRQPLNRPLIQQAAGLMLALRRVADTLAVLLLLYCYPAGADPSVAFLAKVTFGMHAVLVGVAFARYRRGSGGRTLITADVLLTTAVMVFGAHLSEGIYSPILYLLLVEVACFLLTFGPAHGRVAAVAGAAGVGLLAAADAFALWPVGGRSTVVAVGPRLIDFGTKLAASALLLIGITRVIRWVRAKERELRVETTRAQAAAEFQAGLAELACAALAEEGLRATLMLVCARAREMLDCDAVIVCLAEGDALVTHAVAPAVEDPPWTAGALADGRSASARAARERRPTVDDDPAAEHAEVPPSLRGQGLRRVLALPMVGRSGRVLGTLTCADRGVDRDLRTWQVRGELLAAQGAAAVERAMLARDNQRLLENERQAAVLATTLLDVAREFNLAVDMRALLARLATRAVHLTGASAAVVALWRARDQVYRIEHVHGPRDTGIELLSSVDLGPDVYRQEGQELRLDPPWLARIAEGVGLDPAVVHAVNVPMERGGERADVLTLLGAAEHVYSSGSIALARGLAYQAAITLQNVRLVEDIREASRLKSEFVATMSHELRTPLNVIMGYVTLLLDGAFGELAEEQRNVLRRMQRSAGELFDLVTATLDLNRLEAGKSRVRVEPIAVPDLFAQLEAETAPTPDRSDVHLRWELPSDLPAVETDRAKLCIVLKNLIGNAIKFTERGNVVVAAEPSDDAMIFTVADTGIGIRGEDLPVIFEMFRQVEAANTRRHGGVGLGLYIVKRLLDELRGQIDVESEVGVGSRFRVRVPLRLPGAGPAPA